MEQGLLGLSNEVKNGSDFIAPNTTSAYCLWGFNTSVPVVRCTLPPSVVRNDLPLVSMDEFGTTASVADAN